MKFDVDGARSAGYSDAEIADVLASRAKFDASGARAAGYTDEQIIGRLTAADAMPSPPKPQGIGAQVSAAIRDVPRQVGLTARYGLEGVAGGLGTFVDPLLSTVGLPTVAGGGVQLADLARLPKPQTAQERIVGDASRMLAGTAGIVTGARKAAEVTTGVGRRVLDAMSANPVVQLSGGAGAGAGAGAMRETGGDTTAQLVGAVGGGLAGGGLASIAQALPKVAGAAGRAMFGSQLPPNIDLRIEQILSPTLKQAGTKWGDLPASVKAGLRRDVAEVISAGGQLDDAAVRRLADYRLLGLTPTRGAITQSPVDITAQKNLAKIGANSADPSLQALPQIEHANMRRLAGVLDDLGASPAPDHLGAGTRIQEALRAKDVRAQAHERALYQQARDATGRAAPLDRAGFVTRVDELLAQEGKHAFLPTEFRNKLNTISLGQVSAGGKAYDVPFNVDVINAMKTELATAQRSTQDGNVKRAISLVRQALDETPIEQGGMADDVAANAMKAFEKARAFARARRNWQESASSIRDTLDGVPPDQFVQRYILGAGDKASTGEVMRLAAEVRKAGATDTVREYLLSHLRAAAVKEGTGADDVARFSADGFAKALDKIGEPKLKIFFNKDELATLQALKRAARYETAQPTGSAVNNSNTAAMGFANLLEKVAQNRLISRLPFGDIAARQPAQNWAAQIRINQAQNVPAAITAQSAKPPMTMPLAPLLVAPGLLETR